MRAKLFSGAAALALLGVFTVATATAQTQGAPNSGQQGAQNPGGPQGDTQPAGSDPPPAKDGPTGAAGTSAAHAPIGAGPETMPAKFDENIAARDRIPIMARPLPLNDEQKRQIYASVMSNTQTPTAQTTAEPASFLPSSVELSELPGGLQDQIPAVRGYKSVKLQDKVLLVIPETRVVVGEIDK